MPTMALASAYQATGKTQLATDLIRRTFRDKVFEADTQRSMIARFGGMLTADDYARRADILLYGQQGPAARDMVALLSDSQQAAARALANQAKEADNVLALHEAYGPRNWRYSAQGSQALEPQSVYDNGKVTTFAFVGNQEMPAIYIENSDGSESLVPKSVDGNLVMVHAVSRKFILRRGKDVLCVFNEAYDRIGINPDTNTTSPSVERIVKGDAAAQ